MGALPAALTDLTSAAVNRFGKTEPTPYTSSTAGTFSVTSSSATDAATVSVP